MSEVKARLTWVKGDYATYGNGGPGKGVRLFSISYRTARTEPSWKMRCDLPGFTSKEWKDDDEAVLQAKAEQLLANWLDLIGGTR